ncbi:MAG TPA: hypothetical protein VF623_12100, partial [Segetibacter sp.]
STYFSIRHRVSSRPAYKISPKNSFESCLNPQLKYIVYNNYLISGSFRVNDDKFERLEEFLKEFLSQKPHYKIIHTGSKKDKEKDKRVYDFVSEDLRGKTTVTDLFDLCSLQNVEHYIGFDGFLMHLFFLQEKKAYVMSRGRWSKNERFFLENYIDPPFEVDSVNKIKEYIK